MSVVGHDDGWCIFAPRIERTANLRFRSLINIGLYIGAHWRSDGYPQASNQAYRLREKYGLQEGDIKIKQIGYSD